MDNSKVLKPIIGPQESAESKKKESNKKKKALIVSALAFLIATGTIATSIAVVKANMPKLEIKFDDWFVESFDFNSMQAFIDENRLSKGDIDKKLPGYVDKKAKDQNVKNADMITNAKLTNKIPEDKNNKLPHGIYVEMTAEIDYAFAYQADLSLEDNPEQETKQLTSISEEPKKQRYYISKDKTKLYVLVYERESDSDESLPEDLQTFNDFKISNCPQALQKLNEYIADRTRRYTEEEFEQEGNWEPGWNIFRDELIGLEKTYIKEVKFGYEIDNNNQGGSSQKVMQIILDNERSNFDFIDASLTNNSVSYNEETATLTIKNLDYFTANELNLDNLQEQIQDYIKAYDEADDEGRYTLDEFKTKMGDDKLRQIIAQSLGIGKEITPPEPEVPEVPENPDEGETETTPFADSETPPPTTPPQIDTSKINNLLMSGENLIIELKCDPKQKYSVPTGFNESLYSFDQVNDRLTVKGLRYFTQNTLTNTTSVFNALDKLIVETRNQYTEDEFKARVEGKGTQVILRETVAKYLKTNGKSFDINLIKGMSFANKQLDIELDPEFNKYVLGNGADSKIQLNEQDSILSIKFTQFFEQVELNDLAAGIQKFSDDGSKYTIEEFTDQITNSGSELETEIKKLVKESIDVQIGITDFDYNVRDFNYDVLNNHLSFRVTIPKYKKFPLKGNNISCELIGNNSQDNVDYEVTISNLEYWFDLEFTSQALEETWTNTQNAIDNNNIDLASEDNNVSYEKEKQKIFDAISETKLTNGVQIKQYVNLDSTNVTRSSTDFTVNLSAINQQKGFKVRNAKEIDVDNGKIIFDKDTKILKLNNFEYGTPKSCFIIDEQERKIKGLTEKGKTKRIIKFPTGYPKIEAVDDSFNNNNIIEKVYIPEGVSEINKTGATKYFLWKVQNLSFLKLPSTLKKFFRCFRELYNLKNIDFSNNNNKFTSPNDTANNFIALGFDHIVVPKNFVRWSTSFLSGPGSLMNAGPTENQKLDKYVITQTTTFEAFACARQKKLKAICLLSDSVTMLTSNNSYPAFCKEFYGPSTIIYVTNNTVKNAIEKDIREHMNLPNNKETFTSPTIKVINNLKQLLKEDGKLPQDW